MNEHSTRSIGLIIGLYKRRAEITHSAFNGPWLKGDSGGRGMLHEDCAGILAYDDGIL
ncbi:hypothetical protein [Desulfogranum marinum]|uniref:hypothetical protein n=1 Tax=Desulfogranum marinum TaxID=453220 RepID=UPI0029C806A0|nr:hypothetical protein [Desulfogranum marinum]